MGLSPWELPFPSDSFLHDLQNPDQKNQGEYHGCWQSPTVFRQRANICFKVMAPALAPLHDYLCRSMAILSGGRFLLRNHLVNKFHNVINCHPEASLQNVTPSLLLPTLFFYGLDSQENLKANILKKVCQRFSLHTGSGPQSPIIWPEVLPVGLRLAPCDTCSMCWPQPQPQILHVVWCMLHAGLVLGARCSWHAGLCWTACCMQHLHYPSSACWIWKLSRLGPEISPACQSGAHTACNAWGQSKIHAAYSTHTRLTLHTGLGAWGCSVGSL